jgi:GT2 family glycosyltransferase
MSLAVILLNWRNERQTLECARKIMMWRDIRPHLYVVDNESTAATSAILASVLPPDALLCSPRNLGYGGGCNLGIHQALAAGAEYILLLNSDAEISESAVIQLLKRLRQNPQIAVLGPLIHELHRGRPFLFAGGRDIARHVYTRTPIKASELKSRQGRPLKEVDYVPGTVFLTRAGLFTTHGLLDEDYFFSGEIADFCQRIKDGSGGTYIDLEVSVRHDPTRVAAQLRETLYNYYNWRNRLLYVQKHYFSRKTRYSIFWMLLAVLALGWALARGRTAKARAITLALIDAHAGRFGNRNDRFCYP